MAARKLRPQHTDEIRAKIQTSQILNRLKDHVDGAVELTPSQVQSAKILLDKSLSNAATDVNLLGSVNITWGMGQSKREA